MEKIRLATKEEIEGIKTTSDLEYAQAVYALDAGDGHALALGVYKTVPELDPVYFLDGCQTRHKARFILGIEDVMRLSGLRAYYFSVNAKDEQWRKAIEHWGAELLSPTEEVTYKKIL